MKSQRDQMTVSAIKRKLFREKTKKQFDSIYKNQSYLGSGTQGQVYKAQCDECPVAIKYFRRQYLAEEVIRYIQSEIQTLQEIKHENILAFIDANVVVLNAYSKKHCVITQFCQESLSNYHVFKDMSNLQKLQICRQIVAGLTAAHDKNIMHRDIKPQNILIKDVSKMSIKVADFGCSRTSQQNVMMTSYIGTPLFSDPNIKKGNYTVKCDVYSVGLVIIFVFTGKHYFSGCKSKEDLDRVQERFFRNIIGESTKFLQQFHDLSKEIKNFLIQITYFTLCPNEQDRMNSKSLLQFIENEINTYHKQLKYGSAIIYEVSQSKIIQPSDEVISIKKPSSKGTPEKQKPKQIQKKHQEVKQEKPQQVPIPQIKIEISPMRKKLVSEVQKFQEVSRFDAVSEISMESSKSKESIRTKALTQDEPSMKSYSQSKVKVNHQDSFSPKNLSNNQTSEEKFETPQGDEIQDMESPFARMLQSHNSFDNFDFQRSAVKGNQSFSNPNDRVTVNLKTNSSILQSRNNLEKIKNTEDLSKRRKNKIEQSEKKLTQEQKLASILIRQQTEFQLKHLQLKTMSQLLSRTRVLKLNFETVKQITKISSISMSDAYKVCVSFFFHYFYVCKLRDIIIFVSGGQNSNVRIDYVKLPHEKRQTIFKIVNKEFQRVYPNLTKYITGINRNYQLIKPRLPNLIIDAANQIAQCQTHEEMLSKVRISETVVRTQIKRFIEERFNNIRHGEDSIIIKNLSRALSKM